MRKVRQNPNFNEISQYDHRWSESCFFNPDPQFYAWIESY